MPIGGDDPAAKTGAGKFVWELGFHVVRAGPFTAACPLEPLAMLLIHLARNQGCRPASIGFKLLRRSASYVPAPAGSA